MTEQFESDNLLPPQQNESDIYVLIKKIQQQLVFLEKKIDVLISQSQEKPFREKHFSKPFRSFDRSRRSDREKGGSFGEKNFPQGRSYEKPYHKENRDFGSKKKSYEHGVRSDFGNERHFEKSRGNENRGFGRKKRPFFHKRRDRG